MHTPLDLRAMKGKQKEAWSSGDYTVIGTTLTLTGELLAESCDLNYDEIVLDVAAGNGNATLAAARRGCKVTSTDYVCALLERGRERARAEHFDVAFQEADAEALPFEDATFDAVLSTFGVMFTPDQKQAAAELARVCRPSGRIGLTCWTPEGFVGQLFSTLGRYLPSPDGAARPSDWGIKGHLHELFIHHAADVRAIPRQFNFRYRSARHFIEVFRDWYGPMHKAFKALSEDQADRLTRELTELLVRMNRSGKETPLVVPAEYLEIVITRNRRPFSKETA
ncbi:SAM-dependent methyltransferase [Pseudomonas floridensis]|uniref:SAM-dependent methyltransferase n=1 Tax=Pseudomonas floridensis TaxID=1958950 RepID=A0A1X0NEH1_9PSED|nr:class I SAM-dependent methyltransferase [Pseudomonas floridensis]ORC62297.1 SAM-dependent methyltransferase [Pseudomonas floridensis]